METASWNCPWRQGETEIINGSYDDGLKDTVRYNERPAPKASALLRKNWRKGAWCKQEKQIWMNNESVLMHYWRPLDPALISASNEKTNLKSAWTVARDRTTLIPRIEPCRGLQPSMTKLWLQLTDRLCQWWIAGNVEGSKEVTYYNFGSMWRWMYQANGNCCILSKSIMLSTMALKFNSCNLRLIATVLAGWWIVDVVQKVVIIVYLMRNLVFWVVHQVVLCTECSREGGDLPNQFVLKMFGINFLYWQLIKYGTLKPKLLKLNVTFEIDPLHEGSTQIKLLYQIPKGNTLNTYRKRRLYIFYNHTWRTS